LRLIFRAVRRFDAAFFGFVSNFRMMLERLDIAAFYRLAFVFPS
jgi:hypothetical protein